MKFVGNILKKDFKQKCDIREKYPKGSTCNIVNRLKSLMANDSTMDMKEALKIVFRELREDRN